ncbi:hypothetical protein F3Y22_tig00110831pilonHSYRG00181 [Hibiscus syriacus]|uniref:Uncharacterized protein n=1 Tax=Hibiscus syriacus TaxID=106335 RepID=A0A6A2ZLI6_HIBSY|nr:hypothetical protein F3Y22_tig00110831pilonHSYRG00181 [Hibiscus syriacus]
MGGGAGGTEASSHIHPILIAGDPVYVHARVSNRGRVFGYFGFTVIAGAIAAVADAIAAVAGNSDGGETAISRPKSCRGPFFKTLVHAVCVNLLTYKIL